MTPQEKVQRIKKIIVSNEYHAFKEIREGQKRVKALIDNLRRDYDMPSDILLKLRSDNDFLTTQLVKLGILDPNLSAEDYNELINKSNYTDFAD